MGPEVLLPPRVGRHTYIPHTSSSVPKPELSPQLLLCYGSLLCPGLASRQRKGTGLTSSTVDRDSSENPKVCDGVGGGKQKPVLWPPAQF